MSVIPIDDPADPRIAAYRDIRERDLVGREGRFIAEGLVVLEKLVSAGRHPLNSILVAEAKLLGLKARLAALSDAIPIYAASQAVMDEVAGFPMHRGVLALGERAEPSPEALLEALPAKALVLGLFGIANHDNMGGLFRNAAAFGADAVLLNADCCDPLYRKAIRVSVGAALTTPFARLAPGADLAGLLVGRRFEVLALTPGGAETLAQLTPSPRQAVLFGAEGPGLPAELLARCRTLSIPMARGFDSLNVATTSGIVLHRLAELQAGAAP